MIDHRVYLVTDDPSRYAGNWLDNIRSAVEGGVTCVQYRDTESDRNVRYQRALALRDALAGVPLIINNDVELARAIGAEGVHVGQSDMPPDAVRRLVGRNCEIGWSITGEAQLVRLEAFADAGAVDCIGIGPVFDARRTKADAADALGLDGLKRIAEATAEIPNSAIGGITLANAADVIASGAMGLAVVSAFSKAEDPYEIAKKFRMLFDDRR